LSATARITQDYTCTQTGEITIENVTGGTPPYFYSINDGTTTTGSNNPVKGGLVDGTYTLSVSDANGCSFTITPNIVIAPLPTAPALASAVVYNCDGTGNITITPTPAGAYTYSLDGGTAQAGNVFNNVAVGGHTITVDYGRNCTVDINVTVEPNNEFVASVTGSTDITCNGGSDGTITLSASNYGASYQYSLDNGGTWSGAIATSPFTITNVALGTYNDILIRPNAGSPAACTLNLANITIGQPTVVVAGGSITKEVTCTPATGATIAPTGSGGNGGPYSYELFLGGVSQGTTTSSFTNIAAGTYTIVATDVRSCTSAPFTITVDPADTVTFTATPACYDGTNGTINISGVTGNGNYQYSLDGTTWQTPASIPAFSITGLSAGNYNVTIRDGAGCTATQGVTINPQLLASADVTNASCSTGQIQVNPTGGTTTGYIFSVVPDGDPAGAFTATNPIIGLAANTYDVYVRDSAGCEYIIQNVVVSLTTPVSLTNMTPNNPQCNGDTGSIDGEILNGEAPFNITVENTAATYTDNINGLTVRDFSFNNLVADSYTVTVTDALNCTNTYNFTLTELPAVPMNIEPILPANCLTAVPADTGIDFNFKNLTLADFTPYTLQYTIDGTTWINMSTLAHSVSVAPHPTPGDNLYSVRNLVSGTSYFPAIRILNTDSSVRCLIENGLFVMPFQVEGIVVNVTSSGNCTTGYSVTVEAVGGTGPYSFGISTDDPINSGIWYPADDPVGAPGIRVFNNIIPGLNYLFYVRDLNGCIQTNDPNIPIVYPPDNFDVSITPSASSQSCNGSNNGSLQFNIDDIDGVLAGNTITWQLYDGVTDSPLPITGTIANTVTYPFVLNSTTTPVANLQNLGAGRYFIVIERTAGGTCNWASGEVDIREGTAISGNLNKLNDITCSVDGLVRIENVVGGFGGYSYEITAATNTTGLTFPIAVTGNTFSIAYGNVNVVTNPVDVTVEVTDSNGCTQTLGPVTLNVSQLPTIDSVVANSCATNNTITINASGGVGPYQFSTDNGTSFSAPTTSPFVANGLTAGSYDIIVRDANGCQDTQANVIIHEDVDFNLQVTTNAICTANGVVTLNVTSGSHLTGGVTADYSYSVNGAPAVALGAGTTSVAISLTPGTYNISVTDNNTSCSTATKEITLQDPIDPNFTYVAENSLCFGDNSGRITVTAVNNGVLPLTYTLNGPGGPVTLPVGDGTFTNLGPGTYSITAVSGVNNCSTTINNIAITEFNDINLPVPTVSPFACATGNTPGNATVTIPGGITGGSGTYTRVVFVYDNGTPADNTDDVTQDSNTMSFTTSNILGGAVAITVYDDQGCSATTNATINALDVLSNASVTVDNAITCNTGEDITVGFNSTLGTNANITIEGTNGHTYGPVTQNNVASGDFDALPTGEYQITITHPTTGCQLVTYHTVLAAPTFDLVISDIRDETCRSADDGSVELSFSPTTPYTNQYDYVLYDAGTNTPATDTLGNIISGSGVVNNTTINNIQAGTYYVVVTLTATAVTGPPAVAACTSQSANFTIEQPAVELLVTANLTAAVSCNGVSDATITATAQHGWGSYTYQLEDLSNNVIGGYTYSNNNVFTGLAAGDYRVRVIDANGCPRSTTINVPAPAVVTFGTTHNDNSCDTSTGG
uniref:beta strand repeat-containing protein n=2 Tax=uncultured Tenacibaculum sp. TaxID=174713 RepID=UPI002606C3A8